MPIDPKLQRTIMGRFATGVTVVTMKAGDTLWGMTANAVTSLSLDPPLVTIFVSVPLLEFELLSVRVVPVPSLIL